MILYEFEGKQILSQNGINVPKSQLVISPIEEINIPTPFFAKVQVLSGKRKDVGGIVLVEKNDQIESTLKKMLGSVVNKEKVEKVLIEESVDFSKEYYISISYGTNFRSPVVTYSEKGGTGIEERQAEIFPVDILTSNINYPDNITIDGKLKDFIQKLLEIFLKEDALLIEINPVVITSKGEIFALDAKIKLDDDAKPKHPDWNFPPRAVAGHVATNREIIAKKIDEGDYRGTAGATFFDLDGDIAVLASGGGASITAMDALLKADGRPANYTEYGGNPPKEKVTKLTEVVLSKKNIHGLWIVGAVANFTDIYETLSGFLEALRTIETKPKFPIVVRRGGPRDEEAFEMLRKVPDFDFHIYGSETSITESAKIMADLAKQYATNS